MQPTRRTPLMAIPPALSLASLMTSAVSAQVASLIGPDETPTPDAAQVTETELVFADGKEALPAFAQYPAIGSDGLLQRGGGQTFADLGIDPRSEAFRAAQEICTNELGSSSDPFASGRLGAIR